MALPAFLMGKKARVAAVLLTFGAFLVTAAGSVHLGYQWSENSWLERERKWIEAANEEQLRQERELGKVQAEVERLRARPERVKTVTQEVVRYVQADAKCESLPSSFRELWNAEPTSKHEEGVTLALPVLAPEYSVDKRIRYAERACSIGDAREVDCRAIGQVAGAYRLRGRVP
jgi:hypothetical protein